MSFFNALDERYRVILCDIWGCIHDGMDLYPGAADRLRQWKKEGRRIVLVSNAPRPAATIEAHLLGLGLEPSAWDAVATGGDAGIEALKGCADPVGFIGTSSDRFDLVQSGVRIADSNDFSQLACTGLDGRRDRVADYGGEFTRLAKRDVVMHCLNPDRIVIHGGVEVACAGSLADVYLELGGRVEWYGKPYPAIYRHALRLAGDPPEDQVLAVGDSLATDVLGAARMGLDCVFVTGGIHRGEPFPDAFAHDNDLGSWRPLAVVDSLA